MKSPFPLAVHSLTRFWWDAADYLASVAQKRLGLWPVPAKPFLPRAELEELAGRVSFLEAILRRLFCLAALELGPPAAPHRDGPGGAGYRKAHLPRRHRSCL